MSQFHLERRKEFACGCTILTRCPLHAAAPELLAALEMLVDAVTDSTAGSTRAYREHAILDARAAIARARGDK